MFDLDLLLLIPIVFAPSVLALAVALAVSAWRSRRR